MKKVNLIAELCQNHYGDLSIVEEMIHAAKENGADYVKIQSMRSKDLNHRLRFEKGLFEGGHTKCKQRPFNLEYQRLQNDGYLTPIDDISNPEVSSYDINYSTWTSDIGLSWWFAPGSQLSLVWKNGIDNQTNTLKRNWFDNVNDSFSLSQENSLSLKVVYYLDYLYLKKGFKK